MFILNAHLQKHNLILSCAYEVIQQAIIKLFQRIYL